MRLKNLFETALKIYQEKQLAKNNYEIHLSRLFRYAVNLKRMDFISKNCLNPLFREALVKCEFKTSQEFMCLVKEDYKNNKLWFNEGLVCFGSLE